MWPSFIKNHEIAPHQRWWSEHEEIPIIAIGLYMCAISYGPALMSQFPNGPKRKAVLKTLFVGWNLLLSAFSFAGLIVVVPHLLSHLATDGFRFTVCSDPLTWYGSGPPGFWLEAFILSKFPELIDTIFLVLQQKPVIFLHWYHHITVLLFCWQAYIRNAGPGLWYCAMNYSVHSVMYLYYAVMAFPPGSKPRQIARRCAIFITSVQILQMVVGATVTAFAAHWRWGTTRSECQVAGSTIILGLVMYCSYFVLFAVLFVGKYMSSSKKGKTPAVCAGACGESSDAAGMFHGKDDEDAKPRRRQATASPAASPRLPSSPSRRKKSD